MTTSSILKSFDLINYSFGDYLVTFHKSKQKTMLISFTELDAYDAISFQIKYALGLSSESRTPKYKYKLHRTILSEW